MTWQTFGNLAAGNEPASLFDTLTGQIVNTCDIPCTASGSSTITLTPTLNAGPVTSYQFGQLWMWKQVGNSSGPVTINGASIGSKFLYTDNTAATQVGTGGTSLLNNANYVASFDPSLNGAQGGFVLVGTPPVLPPTTTVQRGFLFGLILSGGGSQILTVQAGQASSDDFSTLMTLSSTFTKNFTAWTVGTGNGGLDTGTIATNTWYHIYIIQRLDTNVVDVLISASASAPTLPANYTVKRRIGSIRTDATPNIIPFFQESDGTFWWSTLPALDINATNPGTAAVTATLNGAPAGIRTEVILNINTVNGTPIGGLAGLVSSLDIADTAPSNTVSPLGNMGTAGTALNYTGALRMWTNTSQQIRYRFTGSDGNLIFRAVVAGWRDPQGRYN